MQNLTAEQMKAQSAMIDGMTDEQLRAQARQAGAFNPMMANMDPAMMRQASQMMKNMSPQQMEQMKQMAANMNMPGMGGGMPGMGGMPNMGANPAQPRMQRAQTAPAQTSQPVLPPDQQTDLDAAEKLKLQANNLFKEKKYEEACTKYFSAINKVRLNADLAKTKTGKDAEMTYRSNLAMCKLQLQDYDHVIDQCERILDHDEGNVKANFRMSQAAFALSHGKSLGQLKVALKHATKARDSQPNNEQIKTHFQEVKSKHDQLQAEKEETKTREKPAQAEQEETKTPVQKPAANSMEEKMKSRVKIADDVPVAEEEKKAELPSQPAPEPQQPAQQPQAAPQMQMPNMGMPNMQAPMGGGAFDQDRMKASIDQMANMDDSQMDMMVNMMKANPQMMKANYEAQTGMKMDDAQFQNMINMMNPQMMKQATNMMKQNPDLINKAQEQLKNQSAGAGAQQQFAQPAMQPQAAPTPASSKGKGTEDDPVVEEIEDLGFSNSQRHREPAQQAAPPMGGMPGMGGMPASGGMPNMNNMQDMMNNPMMKEMMNNPEMIKMAQSMMAGGMGGMGGTPDPNKMQEMMQNPSMAKLLENPEMMQNMINMLKSPMARPQVEQMSKQMNMSPENIIRMMEWFVTMAKFYKTAKPVIPIFKYGMIILVLSYLLYWTGFTADLLFMMPFR